MPFSHQQLPASGIEGPSAPDLGKVGGSTAGSPPAKQLDETYFAGIYTKKLPIDPIDHHTNNHFFSFIVPETRMAEVGSLSARAKMAKKLLSSAYLLSSRQMRRFVRDCKFANLIQWNMQYTA